MPVIKMNEAGQLDFNDYSERVASEKETRNKLLSWARQLGYERDMLILFAKFDKLLKNCTNDAERKDIAQLGWAETLKLMGSYGTFLNEDGRVVYSKEDDQRYSLLLNKEEKGIVT